MDDLLKRIKTTEDTVNALSRTRQTYFGDWVTVPDKFIVTDLNYIQFEDTTIDPTIYFGVGTKIRYKLNGNSYFNYGYIGYISGIAMEVYTGNFTGMLNLGDTISEIAYSNLENPLGHPITFANSMTLYNSAGTSLGIGGGLDFYMKGKVLTVSINMSTASVSGNPSYVYASTPFRAYTTSDGTPTSATNVNNIISGYGYYYPTGTTTQTETQILSYLTSTNSVTIGGRKYMTVYLGRFPSSNTWQSGIGIFHTLNEVILY